MGLLCFKGVCLVIAFVVCLGYVSWLLFDGFDVGWFMCCVYFL